MGGRIGLEKEKAPYRFQIVLGRRMFWMELRYNASCDFFTLGLAHGDQLLCAGEKLVWDMPLFEGCYRAGEFPVVRLVPKGKPGAEGQIGWEDLGKTVFLTVDDQLEEQENE